MENYPSPEKAPPAPRGQRQQRSHHVSPRLRALLLAIRVVVLLCSLYLLGVFIDRYVRRPLQQNSGNGRNLNSAQSLAVLILAAVSTGWSLYSLLATCMWHAPGAATVMAVADTVNLGGMVAVAVLLRGFVGPDACVNHGKGTGNTLRCPLFVASFGVAVGASALSTLAAILSLLLAAAFRRARPFGPSPDNDYHVGYNQPPKRRGFITPDLLQANRYSSGPDS